MSIRTSATSSRHVPLLSVIICAALLGALQLWLPECRAEPEVTDRVPPKITILDHASAHAEQLQAAVDPNGRVYLTWIESSTDTRARVRPYVVRQEGPDGWSTPVALNEGMPEPGSAYYPQLNFDRDANVLLVWTQSAPMGGHPVFARSMTADGELGTVIRLDRHSGSLADSYDPRVYFNGTSGRWLAVWSQWDGWADRIMSADLDASAIRQQANPIDAGRSDAYAPTGCTNENGQTLMVWRQLSPDQGYLQDRVYFSIRRDDGEWTTPQSPAIDAKSSRVIAGTCNGKLGFQIFWMQADSDGESRLWAAKISPDLKLASERILLAPQASQRTLNPPAVLPVSVDQTLLVWCGHRANRQGLLYSAFDNQQNQPPAVRFVPTVSGICFNPAIAADRQGRTLSVWVEHPDEDERFSIRAAWGLKGSGQLDKPQEVQSGNTGPLDASIPQLIFPNSFNYPVHPTVVVDGHDQFWGFWTAMHEGRLRVFAANFGNAPDK